MPFRPVFLSLAGLLLAAGCADRRVSTPRWSARGDRAAFVRYDPRGEAALYMLDVSGAGGPRLIAEGVERFAFSPSGLVLYYLQPAAGSARPGLVSVPLAGGGEPRVALPQPEGASFTGLQVLRNGDVFIEEQQPAGGLRLLKYRPAGGGQTLVNRRGVNWVWPRLSPDGKRLACFRAAGEGGGLELVVVKMPGGSPAALGKFGPAGGRSAALVWGPKGKRIAAWRFGEPAVTVFDPSGGKPRAFRLPGSDPRPLVAVFSPDGGELYVSVLVGELDSPSAGTECYELRIADGNLRKLSAARGRLVGARAYAPGGRRWLEFTPAGIALFEKGGKGPARVWPLGVAERAAAARMHLKAGRGAAALEAVTAALDGAGPADDRAALYVIKSEVLAAAGKPGEAANAYLESLLRYPVSGLQRSDARIAKRLAAWSAGQPDHRILHLVAEAHRQRAAGDPALAARTFRRASGFSGDRAWAAGLLFAGALGAMEAGRGAAAGLTFRKVSEVKEFPQADWAAGLAVIAYAAGGRQDMAREEAQRCLDLYGESFLAADFKALAASLGRRAPRARTTGEASGPEELRARLEAWPTAGAHVSFSPRRVPGRQGRARLALAGGELYRLVLVPADGPQKALLDRVPFVLSRLSFSAKGSSLAFLAGPEGRGSLYAVDLAGKALLGDLEGLAAGRLDPRTRCADYTWPPRGRVPKPVKGSDRATSDPRR